MFRDLCPALANKTFLTRDTTPKKSVFAMVLGIEVNLFYQRFYQRQAGCPRRKSL